MKSQVKYLKSTLEQQRSELEVVIQQQDQTVKGVSGQNEKLAKDLELSKSQLKNLQAELEQEKKKQILASTTTIPSAPAATIVNEKRADLASPLTSTDSLAEEGSSNSATAKASVVDLNIYIQKITTLEEEVEKWKRVIR